VAIQPKQQHQAAQKQSAYTQDSAAEHELCLLCADQLWGNGRLQSGTSRSSQIEAQICICSLSRGECRVSNFHVAIRCRDLVRDVPFSCTSAT
jgi:hypothetical protein